MTIKKEDRAMRALGIVPEGAVIPSRSASHTVGGFSTATYMFHNHTWYVKAEDGKLFPAAVLQETLTKHFLSGNKDLNW